MLAWGSRGRAGGVWMLSAASFLAVMQGEILPFASTCSRHVNEWALLLPVTPESMQIQLP